MNNQGNPISMKTYGHKGPRWGKITDSFPHHQSHSEQLVLVSLHKTKDYLPHVVENSRFTRRLFMNTLLEATQISPVHLMLCLACGKSVGLLSFLSTIDWGQAKIEPHEKARSSCIVHKELVFLLCNYKIYVYMYTYVILLFMKNKRPGIGRISVEMKLFCVICFKTSTLDTCQVDHPLAPSCSLYLFISKLLNTLVWF